MTAIRWACLLGVLACAGCCRQSGSDSKAERDDPLGLGNKPVPGTPTTTLAPATTPAPATAQPTAVGFDRSAIRPVADNCSAARVMLAAITRETYEKPGFHWRWADQVMLANPQFKVVPHPATLPGQVSFRVHEHGSAGNVALIAMCAHGGTCNDLAAAYKAIVRSSNPQIFCGSVPGLLGILSTQNGPSTNPSSDLPARDDVISQCARLAACQIKADPSTPGDPGLDCQKRPAGFKLACSFKSTCAEVQACAGR
jgi:hypothetical protein